MRHATAVCSFLPPHILRHIAENGDEAQRERAHATLEQSAQMRGERAVVALIAGAVNVPAGEKRRTVYDAHHGRQLPGALVRGEGAAATGDAAADEAYDGAGKTYDFYRKVFDRNSVDDRGLRLDSTVHYSTDFDNAQWNGRQMIYGDGDAKLFNRFTKCLDIIGHELTHGVTQYTANLEYNAQSGALNESFSDVFGILVKQYALKQTAAKSDWLIGAGLFTAKVHGVALRSMKAPGTAFDDRVLGKDEQPAHMSGFVHTAADHGGVHINSGIPNHAFYLAALQLGGHAWEKAGRIWYETLRDKRLKPTATFTQFARYTAMNAGHLFGATERKVVIASWREVGIRAA